MVRSLRGWASVGITPASVVVTAPTRTSRRDGRTDEKTLFRIDLVLVLDGAGRKAGLADAHRSVQRPTAKGCAEGARQTIRRRYLSDNAKVYDLALEGSGGHSNCPVRPDLPSSRARIHAVLASSTAQSARHWLIAGGESGPNARPMRISWVRQLRRDCAAAEVAFFFKQWGGRTPKAGGRLLDGRTWDEMPTRTTRD